MLIVDCGLQDRARRSRVTCFVRANGAFAFAHTFDTTLSGRGVKDRARPEEADMYRYHQALAMACARV
jgi:hypothetical protein